MPIYVYQCENGHVFEVYQKFSDPPLETCPECSAKARRVFLPPNKSSACYEDYKEFKDVLEPLPPKKRERVIEIFRKYIA